MRALPGQHLSTTEKHIYCASLFILFYLATFARPMLFGLSVAGDAVDSRFNMYILEHTYQWSAGKGVSLISPPMFYPYPLTLFLSDTHFGSSFIYVIFRLLGFSQHQSFNYWYLAGHFLTFGATLHVFARWKFSPLSASLAGAMFAFALPSIAQMGHPQLVHRFCIPFAIYKLDCMLKERDPSAGIAASCWLLWQILINIYLGMFLAMLMACYAVGHVLVNRVNVLGFASEIIAKSGVIALKNKNLRALAILVLLMGSTVCMLYGYWYTARLYGVTRYWDEVAKMLPHPISYLIADHLPYWSTFRFPHAAEIPMRWEHYMFIGTGSLGLLAFGVFAAISGRGLPAVRDVMRPALFALLTLIILVTSIDGYSFYRIIYAIPGMESLRAVTRIILVLAFPAAVLSAGGFMLLMQGKVTRVLALLLGGIVLWESWAAQRITYDGRADEAHIESLVSAAKRAAAGIERPILHVLSDPRIRQFAPHLDAMLAAQRLGWATVDGYSGFNLLDDQGNLTCTTPSELYSDFFYWSMEKTGFEIPRERWAQWLPDLLRRTVVVGDRPCAAELAPPLPDRISTGSPVPPSVARQFELVESGLRVDGELRSWLTIKNHSDVYVATKSVAPVRLSWRFLKDDGTITDPLWTPRKRINGDLPPGGEQVNTITALLPVAPGRYHFQVSLVAEGQFWFHDQGMKILTFFEPIVIAPK